MSLPVMESDSQRKASEERNQLLEEVARVAQEKVEVEVSSFSRYENNTDVS